MGTKKISTATIVYGAIAIVVIIALSLSFFTSTARSVTHDVSEESVRDPYAWSKLPEKLEPAFQLNGYTDLIHSPGAAIGVKKNGIERLSSRDGSTIWSYFRDDATLCDAKDSTGGVVAVFNSGNGCSEIVMLDAATGQYVHNAQYATQEDRAVIQTGYEHIAIVTPSSVNILRDDLVPETFIGDDLYPLYPDEKELSECDISDVILGPKSAAVSLKCAGHNTYHIKNISYDPEESSGFEELLDIDTASADPVTLAAITSAQVQFVVQGIRPAIYTWQLDKEKEEVSMKPIDSGSFGFGTQLDIPGLGYVWRIGNTIHARYGSEDLSQSEENGKANGLPIEANNMVLYPISGGLKMWDPQHDIDHFVAIKDFYSPRVALSGDTILSFDSGHINGYRES